MYDSHIISFREISFSFITFRFFQFRSTMGSSANGTMTKEVHPYLYHENKLTMRSTVSISVRNPAVAIIIFCCFGNTLLLMLCILLSFIASVGFKNLRSAGA